MVMLIELQIGLIVLALSTTFLVAIVKYLKFVRPKSGETASSASITTKSSSSRIGASVNKNNRVDVRSRLFDVKRNGDGR